ncbi:MAG TPA: hypothetical protein VFZ66_26315 [Herpetosiphonaceae bacterium]
MTTPLIVPVALDALVVNSAFQGKQGFRQWVFNYKALSNFTSPEPEPTQGQGTFKPPAPGVYLHWTLPDALRHGTQDPASSQSIAIGYPPVPNRWLIVRLNGAGQRAATGWVVESDCPNPDSPSLYLVDAQIIQMWLQSADPNRNQTTLQPNATAPQVAALGRSFPLAGWSERAASATFLTAVAPGNVAFSMYQPHCQNIFSFYDDLSGIDSDVVSYLVVGWYSKAQDDILAAWPQNTQSQDPYGDLLQSLGWNVVGGSETQATSSLYEGMSFGIPWSRSGAAPPTPLDSMQNNVHVAIGNNTIDAFTALVAKQLADSGSTDAAFVDLLQAFQYGLLPVMEQVNGDELLRLQIHQAWFGSKAGGYRWTIVPKQSDGSAAVDLTDDEAAWLLELNNNQAMLDDALKGLNSLQWNLYATWWKWQKGEAESIIVPPDGFDSDKYKQAVQQDLPAALSTRLQTIQGLLAKVPQPVYASGNTPEMALDQGIAAFAQQKNLSADKQLKAIAAPRYWRTADPAFVLSGVEPAPLPDPSVALDCRLATHLVTGFMAGGKTVNAAAVGAALPTLPNTSALPAEVGALLQEFFLLDPTSAACIASASGVSADQVAAVMQAHDPATYQGSLPALTLSTWKQQPWTAMFMEWQVGYIDIPYQTNSQPNWSFDGKDYHFSGPFPAGATPQQRVVGGRSLLSPEAQFNFGAQLQRFLDTFVRSNPNPPKTGAELQALYDQIEALDHWRFMSQALTGFGDLLALRDTRAQTAPDSSIAGQVGDQTHMVPYIPNGPVYDFLGVRQGQLFIQELIVYDSFGQVLQVVGGTGTTDPLNYAPILDQSLKLDKPVIQQNAFRFAQLPPRVLQHGRLDFQLIDGGDDSKIIGLSAGANPIGGWVLPNHLDNSILLYAPDGTSLGEFRLLENDQGGKSAAWQPPAHSTITLADVAQRAPHLAQMIGDPGIKDPAAFQTFLQVIDETLWTIDPLGNRDDQNLSVLIGRPLALVRARLQFLLDGDPIGNLTPWEVTYPAPQPEFIGYNFAIRLGDQPTRQDGLIGYFTGSSYGTFNSVYLPETTAQQSYVKVIGPVGQVGGGNYLQLQFNTASTIYVTMLVDPRASVHAVTGILPAKLLDIPAQFVDGPLSNMQVTFRIGPLLTNMQPSPMTGDQPVPPHDQAISYPFPAEQNGVWSWWEQNTGYDLIRTTPNARLKDLPNTLREGFLQLVTNLQQKSS